MPLYYSSHTTACLTKQALRSLMQELLEARPVTVRRAVSSQLAGRMILECEAEDQKVLEQFLTARNITSEWVMRIDLDASDGHVLEC
jgi:hypothetical protein